MSCIYFDLGNTRIKWWAASQYGVIDYAEMQTQLQMLFLSLHGVRQVVFASVASPLYRDEFLKIISPSFQADVFECIVSKTALGVECAYDDVSKLGIDRWLAIIAAWHGAGRACLIVDMGTATTLDFVTDDGRHDGGYIVPGLRLWVDSLLFGTGKIRFERETIAFSRIDPGKNTQEAVLAGALAMLVASVGSFYERLRLEFPGAALILSGGDADKLSRWLRCPHDVRPCLVLEGMKLLHANLLTQKLFEGGAK